MCWQNVEIIIESNHNPPICRFVPRPSSSLLCSLFLSCLYLWAQSLFSLSHVLFSQVYWGVPFPAHAGSGGHLGLGQPDLTAVGFTPPPVIYFFIIHLWKTREPHVRSHQRTHAEMCPRFKSPRTGSRRSYQVLMFTLRDHIWLAASPATATAHTWERSPNKPWLERNSAHS